MLSVFPELLAYYLFAITLLRVSVAIVFLYAAWRQVQNVEAFAALPIPILGSGSWLVWASIVFDVVVGSLLLAGAYAQPAALAGAVGVGVTLLLAPHYLERVPVSRGTAAFMLIILVSLLLLGPGAFAFDLPL